MKLNEADTRANLIDPKLMAAGWNQVEDSLIRREVICQGQIIPGGLRGPNLLCDYVLIYRGKKLAAVEAKKESSSCSVGVRQAKDYAERLACRIAYATNGEDIYQIDMQTGEEKLVDNFLSPTELWAYTFDEQHEQAFTMVWRNRFADVPFETQSGKWQPRYYQEIAINNALEALAKGRNRILLTMATGTGKTSVAFQIAWKLFQSRWNLKAQKTPAETNRRPRILFLTDRNILVDQAFNSFSPFGDDAIIRIAPDTIKKHARVPKNGSVFFTIFQTFMSGKNEDSQPYFGDYPGDFFDFIVIDECHRGGANDESTWRQVLEHFSPAVHLGLTATPKHGENVNTYGYFGEPVYSYSLKQGINDGFLTPFKVCQIVGTMDEYVYNPNDAYVVKGNPVPGTLYAESDFNRKIIIQAREEERVHFWMDRINPHEKTLVFCATQEHALMVRDFINQYAFKNKWFTNTVKYCVRVTSNDGVAGEADLKLFQDNEKTIPTILTTSRKLSTGVDARNVRNIVLMRPCNNIIEFKQIIGRGTRLYEGKEFFIIYDFVKAHHNFADPVWDGIPVEIMKFDERRTQAFRVSEPESEYCVAEKPEKESNAKKIEITLTEAKTQQIKHISSTTYYDSTGAPISAKDFIKRLYEDLPKFFNNEDELRTLWQAPETRKTLLDELSLAGYDREKLHGIQSFIEAENSDIYDVLAYVAYNKEVLTRVERVEQAKSTIYSLFEDPKLREFIDFVLSKYIADGVEELAPKKVTKLVELKYHTYSEATKVCGSMAKIRETFIDFQRYLYLPNEIISAECGEQKEKERVYQQVGLI